ncbi:DUF4157 domain-containing protein [Algoriphagus halophilus]|uniref:eCIS core domain-containing protein n=1 Tax=Algoriphagus halophilus TaxID=226505 RepID=UPI00358EE6A6
MEKGFGVDFTHVRIHTDSMAQLMSKNLGAQAFTHGSDIYFNSGKFETNTPNGKKLMAHELTHVLQQNDGIRKPTTIQKEEEPHTNLTSDEKQSLDSLYESYIDLTNSESLIGRIARADEISPSVTRKKYLGDLQKLGSKMITINSVSELQSFADSLNSLEEDYYKITGEGLNEWQSIKKQYENELLRLIDSGGSYSGIYALNYLKKIFKNTVQKILKIDESDIVSEDFIELNYTLSQDIHLWYGELISARESESYTNELLEVIIEMRKKGQDTNYLIPDWQTKINNEISSLRILGTSAPRNYKVHFKNLKDKLSSKYKEALNAKPRKKGLVEKGFNFVSGALSAVTEPFIEAGKQAFDLGQIVVHFGSFTYYKPSFKSSLADQAAKGASTTDLLKGMAIGIIETPKRLYEAIKNEDWEAIGRESVNIYLLAKSSKQGLQAAKPWIRILRARHAGLKGGISPAAALEIAKIARNENLVIRVRPVENVVVKLRKAGHPAKPEFLKMKTIEKLDTYLGANKSEIGQVGYFEPKLPKNFNELPQRLKENISKRYEKRKAEWNNNKMRVDLKTRINNGEIQLKGNVVVDRVTGKGFTGDYDLFDIRQGSLKGESIEFEALSEATQAALKSKPVEIQHGAHLDWKNIPKGAGQGYADIILNARPKPGSKALIEFHPDGKIRYAFFDD